MSARKHREALTAALGLAAVVALVAAPGAGAKAKGFSLGVAAGDVTASSAILWAHADKSGTTYVQLSSQGGFGACDKANSEAKVKAAKNNDNTVQKTVKKLDPDTAYKYRWCTPKGGKSDTGKFTTAPASNKNETIRFGLSGDQDARPVPGGSTPYWNNFEVWTQIQKQKNDFNVLLGDTIYSDSEVPGYGLSDVATTVAMKWAAYQINLAMKPWAKTRGSTAYYAHWDDHEFINDFSPSADNFPLSVGTVNIDGNELYDRGVEAFTDYNPVTYSSANGIYRSARWGKNLEIFFLDTRSFRSTLANYNGNCDNPPGSGNPDLAPTAPASTRSLFAPLVPQFNNPPPQSCLDAINDPNRTYLGRPQMEKFKQAIAKSSATFKVIFNELPIQQQYSNPYDRWEGYAAERTEILNFLHDNVKNVVFLSTDEHANLVLDARFCTLEDNCPQNSGIYDIVTGPVATATYSDEINTVLDNPNGGSLIQGAFLKPQPPNGIGEECAAIDQYSYAEVEVTKSQLKVDLLDQNGEPVRDIGERDNITPTTPSCASVVIPKQ